MRRAWAAAVLFACRPPIPILNYHSVGGPADPFTLSREQFEEQLEFLSAHGRHTVSLQALVTGAFRQGDLVLTFDDGYADARDVVLPALRRHHMTGTFFIVTGFVGRPGYLDWEGVRALRAAGMEIGSHTVSHLRLGEASEPVVLRELRDSRRALEAEVHVPVEVLAWPYNSLRAPLLEEAAEAGYRAGVSGPVHGGSDPLDLARISMKPGMSLDQLAAALDAHR